MSIDWSRVITVEDEDTVNVIAGKSILYVSEGGSGGGGGDAVWGQITGTLSSQTDLKNALDSKFGMDIVAEEFSPTSSYAPGEYVFYQGTMYRFDNYKNTGNWDPSVVTEVDTIMGEVYAKGKFSIARSSSNDVYDTYGVSFLGDAAPSMYFNVWQQVNVDQVVETYEAKEKGHTVDSSFYNSRKYFFVDDLEKLTPLEKYDLTFEYPPQWGYNAQMRKVFHPLLNYTLLCGLIPGSGSSVNLLTPILTKAIVTQYSLASLQTDGSIRFRLRPDAVPTNTILYAFTYEVFLKAGSYKISGGVTDSVNGLNYVKIRVTNHNNQQLAQDTGSGATFTLTEDELISVYIDLDNLSASSFPWLGYIYPLLQRSDAISENYMSPGGFTIYTDIENNERFSLPEGIWGGYVDFATNTLVKTHDRIASYDPATSPALYRSWISDRDDYVPGTVPTTGAVVIYELPRPISYSMGSHNNELSPYSAYFGFSIGSDSEQGVLGRYVIPVKRQVYQAGVKDYIDNTFVLKGDDVFAPQTMIAPAFDSRHVYSDGDLVTKEGKLCRVTMAPFPGGFEELETTEIAATGSASAGDYLTYDGTLYVFTNGSTVDWNYETAAQAFAQLQYSGYLQEVTVSAADPTVKYAIGDIVSSEGEYYQKTSNAWNYVEVIVSGLINERTPLSMVAPAFSTAESYSVDDCVVYQGALYRFTSAHSAGAWDADDVTQTTIIEEIRGGA